MAVTSLNKSDEVYVVNQLINGTSDNLPTLVPDQMPYAGQVIAVTAFAREGPVGAAEDLSLRIGGTANANATATLPAGAVSSAAAVVGLSEAFPANSLFTIERSSAAAATPACDPGMGIFVTFDVKAVTQP